jgi:hypothetical protein
MRDPRKEPKKGDVLRPPGSLRPYEIAKIDDTVCFYGYDRGRMIPMSYCLLSVWPRLAENFEVIRTAEQP